MYVISLVVSVQHDTSPASVHRRIRHVCWRWSHANPYCHSDCVYLSLAMSITVTTSCYFSSSEIKRTHRSCLHKVCSVCIRYAQITVRYRNLSSIQLTTSLLNPLVRFAFDERLAPKFNIYQCIQILFGNPNANSHSTWVKQLFWAKIEFLVPLICVDDDIELCTRSFSRLCELRDCCCCCGWYYAVFRALVNHTNEYRMIGLETRIVHTHNAFEHLPIGVALSLFLAQHVIVELIRNAEQVRSSVGKTSQRFCLQANINNYKDVDAIVWYERCMRFTSDWVDFSSKSTMGLAFVGRLCDCYVLMMVDGWW